MKTNVIHLKTVIIMCCMLTGCQSNAQHDILAEKEGYQLTKKLVDEAIAVLEAEEMPFNQAEKEDYTKNCISQFLEQPKEVIEALENFKSHLESDTEFEPEEAQEESEPETETKSNQESKTEPKAQANTNLAAGHKYVRQILGTDIGEMQFDTPTANTFRTYMTNTLLSSSTNNYNKSPGGKDYSKSSDRIQFCADGTYLQATYSEVIINVPGADAGGGNTTYVPGYWEVAALPNGIFLILMYSTHPNVIEDFPNGFQPWIVPKYGTDFVSLPNGELYKRTPNSYCN